MRIHAPLPHHRGACPLWQRISALDLQTVAVMGMSKNTGKTVCLNHLLAQTHADHKAVGITSIGRDGEARDQVFSIPKPSVRVTPGCLVATAKDTLLRSKVRTQSIGATGVDTPMGEVLIVKALESGAMEVAGPSRSHDQHKVMALLRQCGAHMVLIDGALGRSQHASPAIADGVILSTGAAIGGDMDDVLRKTRDRLDTLCVATAPADLAAHVQTTFDQGGVGVWRRDGACLFQDAIATINAAPTLLSLPGADIGTIAVSGAVGHLLWQAVRTLLARHPGLTLVVADGTKLFIDAMALAAFKQAGGRLAAMRGIRLIGLTLNPWSPWGGSFEASAFLARGRTAFAKHVVTDVMQPSLKEGPCPTSR